jgi:lipopolysaccharide biosynthesis regulator YciM
MNKRELDFHRTRHGGYEPFTPRAAIKAFENDIVPIEFFIYKGASVKSIEEKPYDFEAIDRILSRKNTDFQIKRFLVNVFDEMVKDRDAERALYAAEGINSIESRYNKRIEKLKKKLKKHDNPNIKEELAGLYFELALLNEKQQDIKKYFLKTAYTYLKQMQTGTTLSLKNLELLINILLEFKFYKKALQTIKNLDITNNPHLLLLLAKVEFKNKHYAKVHEAMRALNEFKDSLDEETIKFITYWTGENGEKA